MSMKATRWWLPLAGAVLLAAAPVTAQDPARAPVDPGAVQASLLDDVRAMIGDARGMAASKRAPLLLEEAQDDLAAAEAAIAADPAAARDGAAAEEIAAARATARRLIHRLQFIRELRDHRYGWEEAAIRYDGLVADVAALLDIRLDPGLGGPVAGRALVDSVLARRSAGRALVDSLTRANRSLQLVRAQDQDLKDSTLVQLQAELSSVRKQLWDVQLRAGVVEADRSASREALRRRDEQEEQRRWLADLYAPGEGEVLLTPGGDVTVRLTGLRFAVGSSTVGAGAESLMDKLASILQRFPGVPVRVEGHTDDTGARDVNMRLSANRARAVAGILYEKLGLPEGAITVEGFGPDRPAATNATAEGRALNRRIDVVILAGEGPE